VNSSHEAIGAFFGDDIGKVRLYGRANAIIVLYVLTAPTNCDSFWITTSATDTFSLGGSLENGTLSPSQTACLWYINDSPAVATVTHASGAGRDALRVFTDARTDAQVKEGRVRLPGPITLFLYRPADAFSAFAVDFGGGPQALPVVHAAMRRRSADFVFQAERRSLGFEQGNETRAETGNPETFRSLTAALALACVAIGSVIAGTRGTLNLVGKEGKGPKPVVAVAAFAPGAKIGFEQEEIVNTAAFFPDAHPS
jgi:hypothetical protein